MSLTTGPRSTELTRIATDLRLALEDNTTEPARECAHRLSTAEGEFHEARRVKLEAHQRCSALAAEHAAARKHAALAVAASVRVARLFELEAFQQLAIEPRRLAHALEELRHRFLLHGDFGARFAERLGAAAQAYQRSLAMLEAARHQRALVAREHAAAAYRLRSAVGLCKAVLKSQGLPLPSPPARPRRSTVEEPAVTVPVTEVLRLAPAPAPLARVS